MKFTKIFHTVSEENLSELVERVCAADEDLKRVVGRTGLPPLWKREENFATLMHIILEQQVSLASAKAVFDAVCRACPPEAEPIRAFGEEGLRSIGVTRQKARYIVGAAEAVGSGILNLISLRNLKDEAAREKLMSLKGIGRWTADVYLLMAMCRADVFPSGDLALQIAAQGIKRLPKRPTAAELEQIAEAWRPCRAVAARVLWQWYLMER